MSLRVGDRVRTSCTATGRYLGDGLALVVSAQDNDLFVDFVAEGDPHPSLPVPSDQQIAGACAVLLMPGVLQVFAARRPA